MKSDLEIAKPSFIFKAFQRDQLIESKYSVFPYELSSYADTPERLADVQEFIDSANLVGKRTVLYFAHDNDHPISKFLIGNPIVFRNSMSRNHNYGDEFIIPTRVEDFRKSVETINTLDWHPTPKVSFMGWAVVTIPVNKNESTKGAVFGKGLIAPLVFPTPTSIGTLLRKKAMEFIENDARINSNFTIFDRYFHHQSEEFQNQNLQHYLKSMSDTHYILTIRGCGNYSIRLFETMAANRIPVMVDTNQYLPFEDKIPWKEIGVWVPFPQFNSISDFIFNFHERLNQKSFDELTREIENIYENSLSRPSVVKQIRQILLEYV